MNPNIPESLMYYQPQITYEVLDISQIQLDNIAVSYENLVLPLIELEKARNTANMQKAIKHAAELLKKGLIHDNNQDKIRKLKRAYFNYVNKVFKITERFPEIDTKELEEVDMLHDAAERWEMFEMKVEWKGN